MKKHLLAILLCLSCGVTSFATEIIEKITPTELSSMLKNNGYSVTEVEKEGVRINFDGTKCVFFISDNNRFIQLWCAFSTEVPLEKLNTWNQETRFGKTYASNGGTHLEIDLDLTGGITEDRLLDFFKTCKMILWDWEQTVLRSQ